MHYFKENRNTKSNLICILVMQSCNLLNVSELVCMITLEHHFARKSGFCYEFTNSSALLLLFQLVLVSVHIWAASEG